LNSVLTHEIASGYALAMTSGFYLQKLFLYDTRYARGVCVFTLG